MQLAMANYNEERVWFADRGLITYIIKAYLKPYNI